MKTILNGLLIEFVEHSLCFVQCPCTPVNYCGIILWLTDDIWRWYFQDRFIDATDVDDLIAGWRVWENIYVPSVVCHRINNTHIVGTNRTKRGIWRYIFKKKRLPFI